MYSVVLATMLTAGAQSTTWCHRAHGCHGCNGCSSCAFTFSHGCHNYCSGCYCSGCWGGGCWCSGWSRGCHSCSVSVVLCYGCNGCNGCSGCNGWACSGCVCSGCVCNGCQCSGGVQARPTAPPEKGEKKKDRKRDKDDDDVSNIQARVVVKLPAEARLWVDQVACPLEGTVRSFDTPTLEPGQRYAYTLRVQVERNGQRVEESRRVPLTAGQRVEVDFTGIGATSTAQN